MALTRALPPCGDNTLADGGCLPTAAAETQVGPLWRRVPPSEAKSPALGPHCTAMRSQAGLSTPIRAPAESHGRRA